MDLGLTHKRFLVTGASRGIGKAIAAAFLAEGSRVALVARGEVPIRQTALELSHQAEAGNVLDFVADCTDEIVLKKVCEQIIKKWGGLDGVIANVGDGRSVPDPIPDVEQWSKIWSTNFETALNTARVFLPLLQKSLGNFLFISGNNFTV